MPGCCVPEIGVYENEELFGSAAPDQWRPLRCLSPLVILSSNSVPDPESGVKSFE